MNRKNTILVAVMINAGLLAVLLITALTTQEEVVLNTTLVAEDVPPTPKFDDTPLLNEPMKAEMPLVAVAEPLKIAEIPLAIPEETLVHKLPPLVPESAPVVVPESVPA